MQNLILCMFNKVYILLLREGLFIVYIHVTGLVYKICFCATNLYIPVLYHICIILALSLTANVTLPCDIPADKILVLVYSWTDI